MNSKPHRRPPVGPHRNSKTTVYRRSLTVSHAHSTSTRSLSGSRKSTSVEASEDEEMAGLPQFCTTCEKQIVCPSNSILYCSEACRRKDALRPVSAPSTILRPSSIPSASTYFDRPEPEIIPPRSPTIMRPTSFYFQDDHPTSDSTSPTTTDDADEVGSDDPDSREAFISLNASPSRRQRRHSPHHRSSKPENRHSMLTDGIPSLSHTPSSSVGTVASIDTRPLPSRHAHRSSGTIAPKSIDLVIPSFEYARGEVLTSASLASSASGKTAFRRRSLED